MKTYTLEEAHQLQLKGDLPTAEQVYVSILNEHPDHWLCLFFYGTLCLQTHRNGLAIILFEAAARVRPQAPEIWNNLGTAYKRENFNDRASACLLRSLSLTKDADTLNNMSTIFINEGCPEKGEKYAKASIDDNPDNAFAHWNYSLTLLEQGKYKEGFKQYAWGLRSKDRKNKNYDVGFWQGEKNKKVVVWGEQGIGDEIMFASCIPDLKKLSRRVVFDCHPRLKAMFERSFGVTCYPTRKIDDIDWHHKEDIDSKIPIGGLPQYFRKSVKEFPGTAYLKADPERVRAARERLEALGPGPYIGISWHGGKKKTRNDLRSIPLKDMTDITTENAQFISLQYTKEHEQEARDAGLIVWPDIIYAEDYDETAALVMALDLVISVNTSVVHLAGALGKDCWVLTPTRRAWRYYEPKEGQMVWYNSVKQYSQINDDWTPAIERLVSDLSQFCDSFSGQDGDPGFITGEESHPIAKQA